jgi:hypothetical protein
MDVPSGHRSVAAIESVFERGGASDVAELLAALRGDPWGEAAAAALVACERSTVYGYPALVRKCLEKWRAESPRTAA